MVTLLNEESVEKKLKTVNNTQDSIQTLSLWIIHHKASHGKIVELWMRVLRKTVQPSHRLTLLYLCNDVVQTCRKKNANVYNTTFKEYLREAASLVRDHTVKDKVERIFSIWEERGVYDSAFIKSLHSILNGQQVKSVPPHVLENDVTNSPISPVSTPLPEFELKALPFEPETSYNMAEMDAEETARVLADYKPHEMIEQISAFRKQGAEIQLKISQLSQLKIDLSTIEAVKQLKDRAHGNDFRNQLDDSFKKLEELVKKQSLYLEDQRTLLEALRIGETFYEEQYREARIVANAYKSFGARINNTKRKLDDLMKSMPEPAHSSPDQSPDEQTAPSPSSSPTGTSAPGYSPGSPANNGQSLSKKSWVYNETGPAIQASVTDSMSEARSTFQDTPRSEVAEIEVSPHGQSPNVSDNAGMSLESRLASFFDGNQNESSNPSEFVPQLPHLMTSNNDLKNCIDDDNGDDLTDDETSRTPVQDENQPSPTKPDTPAKKENPIDFLSRLINQTPAVPARTGTQSFIDSLTKLSMTGKSSDPVGSNHQTSSPQSWAAWKSENVVQSTQPSSPLPYRGPPSLPTSPQPFPAAPAVVSSPVSIPAPANVPIVSAPQPPPFVQPGASPDLSPPAIQQTPSGEKDKWLDEKEPESSADHSSSAKVANTLILKELTPAYEKEKTSSSSPPSPADQTELPSVIKGESPKAGSVASTLTEAKTEFTQKLKQKTRGILKSHVFVPNPTRPNLMTLTVSDDQEQERMPGKHDNNTNMEETTSRSDKASKSIRRSHSREEDNSQKFKKKREDKHHNSSKDSNDHSKDDSVKRAASSSYRNSSKGDKYSEKSDRHTDHWRYDDRKYDRNYHREHSDQRDYSFLRDGRNSKDSVQAYAEAYKDAFIKQFAKAHFSNLLSAPPPPPMDPRRPFYGKF